MQLTQLNHLKRWTTNAYVRLILVVIGAGELSNINHKHENYRLVGELAQTTIPPETLQKERTRAIHTTHQGSQFEHNVLLLLVFVYIHNAWYLRNELQRSNTVPYLSRAYSVWILPCQVSRQVRHLYKIFFLAYSRWWNRYDVTRGARTPRTRWKTRMAWSDRSPPLLGNLRRCSELWAEERVMQLLVLSLIIESMLVMLWHICWWPSCCSRKTTTRYHWSIASTGSSMYGDRYRFGR